MALLKSPSGKWSLYGSADFEFLVAGHSHAAAILEAKLNNPEGSNLKSLAISYTSDLNNGPPGDAEYWSFVAELAQGKDLVIIWNGNQHNANFLFQTSPPFELIHTEADDKSVGRSKESHLISRSMMESFFEPSIAELTPIIESIPEARSISLLPGPAPKPYSHIVSRISSEAFFVDIANSLGVRVEDLTITSDSLRVQMWQILVDQLKQTSQELGINFIPVPTETIDQNGLLLETFWTPDVTHANSAYGLVLADHIVKYFAGGKL